MQVERNWRSQVNQKLITSQAKSGRPGCLPPPPPMLTSSRTIKCQVESSDLFFLKWSPCTKRSSISSNCWYLFKVTVIFGKFYTFVVTRSLDWASFPCYNVKWAHIWPLFSFQSQFLGILRQNLYYKLQYMTLNLILVINAPITGI